MHKKTLVNVLGVVYGHLKTSDGGDIYLTRFAEKQHKHFDIRNWYAEKWFNKYKIRLKGTGSVYMTGSCKIEKSSDLRRYESHKDVLDPEGGPILQENHNFITIWGYYNGPDQWVAQQTGSLYEPVDLARAVDKGLIDETRCRMLLEIVKEKLRNVNFDGSLLNPVDLLLAINDKGEIVKDNSGSPLVVICNFEFIWKYSQVQA